MCSLLVTPIHLQCEIFQEGIIVLNNCTETNWVWIKNVLLCNECEIWNILFELWVIDVPRHVSYRTLQVRWPSAQQFDTLYRMPEPTLFAYCDFLYNPVLEGNCPHSHNVSFDFYVETSKKLVVVMKKKKIIIMKCWKIFWLHFV